MSYYSDPDAMTMMYMLTVLLSVSSAVATPGTLSNAAVLLTHCSALASMQHR